MPFFILNLLTTRSEALLEKPILIESYGVRMAVEWGRLWRFRFPHSRWHLSRPQSATTTIYRASMGILTRNFARACVMCGLHHRRTVKLLCTQKSVNNVTHNQTERCTDLIPFYLKSFSWVPSFGPDLYFPFRSTHIRLPAFCHNKNVPKNSVNQSLGRRRYP